MEEKVLEINFSQITGRTVSDDYIGMDQFKIDPETRKIIECSQGYKSSLSIYDSEKEIYSAKFYKEHFQQCPLLKQCQVKEQKKAYHISFSKNKRRTNQILAKFGTERHQELSNYLAGVDGVPSVLKWVYQLEHLLVRGRVRSKICIFA
ncbi:hypothetical protein COM13_18910 [Bacillus pseudomycoides]|uniref:transposase n=1 Tax=Bacillus TaxID=1386 RepID=UPI00036BBE5F|nr:MULTISPECIES: transposase [Bacillus]PDX99221.1 hypothetical protein COO07_17520 [Bacillus pseudomycoides]PEK80735.1 hypothetical protein CN597_10000 [Bacillus pseudomycoides]PEN08121.1 hypothetical protein CN640_13885 [Bacillus pseudomycoides]PGB87536.1 hypothetical protein COM13_18910 [Bacillus pseudomycoides]PGS04536.1 hypothetical protein COC54_12670 [Bacillus pseudomycoides]